MNNYNMAEIQTKLDERQNVNREHWTTYIIYIYSKGLLKTYPG